MGDWIRFIRTHNIKKKKFDKSYQEEFDSFMKKVIKGDKSKIVLKRN